jgi:hypothetical protein
MELTQNSSFRLFAANGNGKLSLVFCKQKTEVCFPWFQTINGNWRLLFQQTCPSMIAYNMERFRIQFLSGHLGPVGVSQQQPLISKLIYYT